jgi:hypothetical protein
MEARLTAESPRSRRSYTLLDSQHWKVASVAEKMPFHLDGDAVPTSRTSSRRSWISTAEGIVAKVERSLVWIDGDSFVSLRHSLPASFELSALLGRRVRVTLLHVASLEAGLTQTLTIAGSDGKVLAIGHAGEARGISHTLGGLHVYVALSQRPGGPMVFGTSRLQSLVRQGDHIRVRQHDDDDGYVLQFESRRGREATYAIGAEDLWRGPPSTKR